MYRGEVWFVTLPFASGGREQAGQRPAVIIQDAVYAQGSPLVLIVPLTSQSAALRFPGTVAIDASPLNGLTTNSIALVFQTRALDRSRFVQRVGELASDDLSLVLAELNKLTGQD